MNSAKSQLAAQFHDAGIFPYGSDESKKYEQRLTRILARLYKKTADANSTLESLGTSTREGPIAEKTDDLLGEHYNEDIAFFKTFLDVDFMTYSMAYYGNDADAVNANNCSLEDAQRAKFELICARAEIQGNERILDVGCGFGSLATYLLETYPNVTVVGVTPSTTQVAHLRGRMETAGDVYAQGRFQLEENELDSIPVEKLGTESFDVVFSIGVLEHMRNMEKVFSLMRQWLKPGGRMFHHLIVSRHTIAQFVDTRATGTRVYFPGGRVWPFGALENHVEHFDLAGSWYVNGFNYYRTVDEWHKRFWAGIDKIYPQSLDEAGVRYWNNYFAYCKTLFDPIDGTVTGNGQYLFRRK